ncbi:MAG: factor-independent urate hydroxylase [Pyrinomonadaceae bacterium]
MAVRIAHDSYGKSRVRLLKVARGADRHEVQDLLISIAFEGEFDAIHQTGDNSACLPTDTMKNTVYALAGQMADLEQPEAFGRRLAAHFLEHNAQVSRVRIALLENGWQRVRINDQPHDHAFLRGSGEKRTAYVNAAPDEVTVTAGVEGLIVLKTTRSGFSGFIKDAYTTLPETTDRIFSTAIKATWTYAEPDLATADTFTGIRQSIIQTFAEHDSLSVQHTLYAMGETVLERFPGVKEIQFSLPNIHCLPVDIAKFGLENRNCIFVPTDEPHGLIEARLTR